MPREDAHVTSGLGFQPEVELRRSSCCTHRQDAYATLRYRYYILLAFLAPERNKRTDIAISWQPEYNTLHTSSWNALQRKASTFESKAQSWLVDSKVTYLVVDLWLASNG